MKYDENEIKKFREMSIDINGDDVSDVILSYKKEVCKDGKRSYCTCFKNQMTGKDAEKIEDAIRDGRFIVFDSFGTINGHYVWAGGKENDVMIVITAQFKEGKWVERQRFIFAERSMPEHDDSSITAMYNDDICGQAVEYDDNAFVNFPAVGKQRMQEVLGDVLVSCDERPYVPKRAYIPEPTTINVIYWMMCGIEREDFRQINTPKMSLTMFPYEDKCNVCFSELLDIVVPFDDVFGADLSLYYPQADTLDFNWEIPEGAKEVIKKIEEIVTLQTLAFPHTKAQRQFCILQAVDKYFIQRDFIVDVDVRYPYGESTGRAVEWRRTLINGETNSAPHSVVVYADSAENTVFNYVSWPVEHAVKILQERIDEAYESDEISPNTMPAAYSTRAEFAVSAMCALKNEWLEKLLKTYKKYGTFVKNVYNALGVEIFADSYEKTFKKIVQRTLHNVFFSVDFSADTLQDFLMSPKGLLELCLDKGDNELRVYNTIQSMFKNEMKYFVGMNKQDLEKLVNKIEFMRNYCISNSIASLRFLVTLYGPKNIFNYINFLIDLGSEVRDYEKYMKNLGELHAVAIENNSMQVFKSVLKTYSWKIKGKELEETDAVIRQLLDVGIYNDRIVESFVSQQDKWSQFLFESGNYKIVVPQKPEDVAMEGLVLHHCAKTFIAKVASGDTTLVFIRKKDKPDRPYYTMEIKDNAIRQVHGFDNHTVPVKSEISMFLKSFSKEKGLPYDEESCTAALGA